MKLNIDTETQRTTFERDGGSSEHFLCSFQVFFRLSGRWVGSVSERRAAR